MDESCAGCGKGKQVNWSPAWAVWLCTNCRAARNYVELRETCQQEESSPG